MYTLLIVCIKNTNEMQKLIRMTFSIVGEKIKDTGITYFGENYYSKIILRIKK